MAIFYCSVCTKMLLISDAASRWARWALAHPEFGSSVNPIKTRGADYAHHITASPPGFENPAHSKWDLVGYSGGSPGLENAVKRWGWPIDPISFSVYFDASR